MDIQLQVTDKELEEFPEERSYQISTNIINRAATSLPTSKVKAPQRKTMKGRRTTEEIDRHSTGHSTACYLYPIIKKGVTRPVLCPHPPTTISTHGARPTASHSDTYT